MNYKARNESRTSTQKIENKPLKKPEETEIPDDVKQNYFVRLPFFNFLYAEDELGFNFKEFSRNNFYEFLKGTYLNDLIALRRNYIQRNLIQVRYFAHKFKSPFA
jgi:hypothetical protein